MNSRDGHEGDGGTARRALVIDLDSTGLRLSEALSLSVGDVDLRRGLLTIRRTKFA